jgi:type II secretory pathway predicted ATPase ExeA/septal ring-binding cell division protein DamX
VALYLAHFGLREAPFRITPHTDFFFDGADRGATLEGLIYAILHDEGIVKVSGEIGSGKTTLCRVLMERLPAEVETVFLANPSYSRAEILHAIAEELGRAPAGASGALRDLQEQLIELYGAGRRVVVLIDEAHAMPEDTLEQVRLLSNLETSRHKLLQIVLFGQPELDAALAKSSMRQLKDRITHNFRTRPLTVEEVAKYVAFRMRAAGCKAEGVFEPGALAAIAQASGGLTRRINVLCDKALLAAFAAGESKVTPRHVRAAIADSEFAQVQAGDGRWKRAAAAIGLVALGALVAAGVFWLAQPPAPRAHTEPAPKPAAAAPAKPAAPPAPEAPRPEAKDEAKAGPAPAAQTPAPPAEEKATEKPAPLPALPSLAADQLRRFDGYKPGENRLLRERLAATREALLSAPDTSYSIELFFTENSDQARTERFLVRARALVDLPELHVIPVSAGSRYFLRVAYGTYPDRASADEAARRLPPKYQQAFVFTLRSFAELRDAI